MKRNNMSSGSEWLTLAACAEEKAKRIKLRVEQLEALGKVFRGHAEAGDPCPTDLLAEAKAFLGTSTGKDLH